MRWSTDTFVGGIGRTWRGALVVGLASIPFTTALLLDSGNGWWEYSFGPILAAGAVVGFVWADDQQHAKRIAFRTGVIGAAPVVIPMVDIAVSITGFTQPMWFSVLQGIVLLGVSLLGIVFSALVCQIGAILARVARNRLTGLRESPGSA